MQEENPTPSEKVAALRQFFVPPPPKKGKHHRILVFGTFDIIHPAHLRFLTEARVATNCPDCELVVVLSRDSSIERIKGRKPIFSEEQRLKLISGLRLVDYACLGNEGTDHFRIILDIEPDYIVLGYDQLLEERPLHEFIQRHQLQTKVLRLPKFESGDLCSSSEVRKKVLQMYNSEKEKAI